MRFTNNFHLIAFYLMQNIIEHIKKKKTKHSSHDALTIPHSVDICLRRSQKYAKYLLKYIHKQLFNNMIDCIRPQNQCKRIKVFS